MASPSQDDTPATASAASGKRPRDDDQEQVRRARSEEEPVAKMARRRDNKNKNDPAIPSNASWPIAAEQKRAPAGEKQQDEAEEDRKQAPVIPYAPTLAEFYAPGGCKRFLPRPEWLVKSRQRARPQRQGRLPPFAFENPIFGLRSLRFGNIVDSSEDDSQSDNAAGEDEDDDGEPRFPPPENGLLPDDVFEEFQPPEPPPVLEEAEDQESLPPLEPMYVRSRLVPARAPRNLPAAAPSPLLPQEPVRNADGELQPATFGSDLDSALHVCIREGSTEAALRLLEVGADAQAENLKGVTPLILASQKGLVDVVPQLLKKGANPGQAALNGSTALLQACHFGHLPIVELLFHSHNLPIVELLFHSTPNGGRRLIDMANNHNTTPLMRASQEGNIAIVTFLLRNGAQVNRYNNEQMSALMLASQRGHADIVKLLVRRGANVDATTATDSTALMLCCKRGHANVARVLVSAGCELQLKDNRGRKAHEMALRRARGDNAPDEARELCNMLNSPSQVELVKRRSREERSHTMIQMWTLLQYERANVFGLRANKVSIHEVANYNWTWTTRDPSERALIRTMTLPSALVEIIASYLPLSNLFDERISRLSRQCNIDADEAVIATLDLIDEILEEAGFVEACAQANITPPTNYTSWANWKTGTRQPFGDVNEQPRDGHPERAELLRFDIGGYEMALPGYNEGLHPFELSQPLNDGRRRRRADKSPLERRRNVCFLQLLAYRSPLLAQVLMAPPFRMPKALITKLIAVSDIQSLSRRLGSNGVHFDTRLAMELTQLANLASM